MPSSEPRLPLTPAERAALRQKAEQATPGPWSISKPRSRPFGMIEVPVHVGDGAQRGNAFALVSLGGRGAIGMSEESVVAQASYIAAISPDRLLALLDEVERPACIWREDDDGNWRTGCGHLFFFDTDGPTENQQKFCGYCGGPLVEVRR